MPETETEPEPSKGGRPPLAPKVERLEVALATALGDLAELKQGVDAIRDLVVARETVTAELVQSLEMVNAKVDLLDLAASTRPPDLDLTPHVEVPAAQYCDDCGSLLPHHYEIPSDGVGGLGPLGPCPSDPIGQEKADRLREIRERKLDDTVFTDAVRSGDRVGSEST